MRVNLWMIAGIAAPVVYVAAVVIGGWMTPGYNHVYVPIAALNMQGAPAAWAVNPLFITYNILLTVMAVGLRGAFRDYGVRIGILAPTLLLIAGLTGLALVFYPTDLISRQLTGGGAMHTWLAITAAAASILTVLTVAVKLRRDGDWPRFAGYSFISLIVILFAGGFALIMFHRLSPVVGIWERLAIGAFLQWILALAATLAVRQR